MVLNRNIPIDPSFHLKKCIVTFRKDYDVKPCEGLLYNNGKNWFVFQNALNGSTTNSNVHEKHGFEYSWCIGANYSSSQLVDKIEVFLEEDVDVWY